MPPGGAAPAALSSGGAPSAAGGCEGRCRGSPVSGGSSPGGEPAARGSLPGVAAQPPGVRAPAAPGGGGRGAGGGERGRARSSLTEPFPSRSWAKLPRGAGQPLLRSGLHPNVALYRTLAAPGFLVCIFFPPCVCAL